MLYDRWREVARAGGSELALKDLCDGRAWTFAQLFAAADRADDPGANWVCPKGNGPEFVLEVLRGWRHGRVVCPLEETDALPNLPSPPPNIAHVKRTSATTGAARFVTFTGEQLAADCKNIVVTMGLRREWPNLAAISLAHSYGFSNLVLPLLLEGIPLLLVKSPLPAALRTACAEAGDVTLAGVPALWRAWQEAGAISRSIKLAISAGAPLPLALEREVLETTGVKIHNFLGSTECGGIAYDRGENLRSDAAVVGSAMENVSLSVSDGMLEVRGAAVGTSYWPEARPELADGVFRTSDLVEIRNGILFMRGRATDVIHIAGRKVAPEEIERALSKHPAVKECLVFGAPRNAHENQIVAVVVGDESALEKIKQSAGSELPAWKTPRQWMFVDSLGANER
ncbi:MAG TPA: fatty acid--CoA ligase family protein, partial [Verrucomicrobiae bacterium]